ncbi:MULTISPECIES: hypothetical protein [Staphylococcus]|nr:MULTISPECIES: hypothetical protein [Staphylococcus]MDK7754197.1 hypothetical protein [Staphylococcus sp. UMB10092B]BCQ19293.1 hypothetical protein BDH17TP_26200 [Staphylococcus aureus]
MDYRTKKSKEKVANMIEEIKNNPFEWVIDYDMFYKIEQQLLK